MNSHTQTWHELLSAWDSRQPEATLLQLGPPASRGIHMVPSLRLITWAGNEKKPGIF